MNIDEDQVYPFTGPKPEKCTGRNLRSDTNLSIDCGYQSELSNIINFSLAAKSVLQSIR